ncbi:MAG: formylglycine-generating enzyme family protein [Fuerstiella sp.]
MLQRFVSECVQISPGTDPFPVEFVMGAESPGDHQQPRRKAAITHRFRISRYETTQELYLAVMGENPSRWKGPRNSVENVSFQDATRFCERLTGLLRARKHIADHEVVRLPTSVEWEYCCRAGSTTAYCFGDDASGPAGPTATLDQYAWHTGNAAGNDPAVGVLKPNAWGLHDVHGYLWEYCSDPSADETSGTASDASEKDDRIRRTIRGGSWRDQHTLLSSSTSMTVSPEAVNDATGFRCVIAQKPQAKIVPAR